MNNIKLELNLDEINVILNGLSELPAKISMDIIIKVRTQAISQLGVQNTSSAEIVENGQETAQNEQ